MRDDLTHHTVLFQIFFQMVDDGKGFGSKLCLHKNIMTLYIKISPAQGWQRIRVTPKTTYS